jgi:hypothetical protein
MIMSSISVKESRVFTHEVKDGDEVKAQITVDALDEDQPVFISRVDPSLSIDDTKRLIVLLQTAVDNYERINK